LIRHGNVLSETGPEKEEAARGRLFGLRGVPDRAVTPPVGDAYFCSP
jgi:hypothetical protein